MTEGPLFVEARQSFHAALLQQQVLRRDKWGIPSNADKHAQTSVAIAQHVMTLIGQEVSGARLAGQMSGKRFEEICAAFLEQTFRHLSHLRPGRWEIGRGLGGRSKIAAFAQYQHLAELERVANNNTEMAMSLGRDYIIQPDIMIVRHPEDDGAINEAQELVNEEVGTLSDLRKRNGSVPTVHASVSCKWTIRSDRSQNSRSEALNLVRNRKGRLPHIAVVTGEPMPSRIASIALGTGDIDCVYHFALPELREAASVSPGPSADLLDTMVKSKRVKDITDLPLDLVL